jgi:hypothetical protein
MALERRDLIVVGEVRGPRFRADQGGETSAARC